MQDNAISVTDRRANRVPAMLLSGHAVVRPGPVDRDRDGFAGARPVRRHADPAVRHRRAAGGKSSPGRLGLLTHSNDGRGRKAALDGRSNRSDTGHPWVLCPDGGFVMTSAATTSAIGETDVRSLYRRAQDRFGERVHGVRDDRWTAATP